MPSLPDEKIGDATLRIVAERGGYRGCLIRDGKSGDVAEDTDLAALQARLRNEAGKLHPDYIGIDGAVGRFLHFFPGGFGDPAFGNERDYKLAARNKLKLALPIERAATASAGDAVAVRAAFNTNMLSRFELARVHAILGSEQGALFVHAAARFTSGDLEAGLAGMVAAIAPHGRSSWPMLTFLPSLWAPERHMFLKPNATMDFAQRTGHRFQFAYRTPPDAETYRALLDLVAETERNIAALEPVDRTDVQSFIWVVGSYTDADMPLLEKLRASA